MGALASCPKQTIWWSVMSNLYDNVSGLTPTYPSQNIAWPIPKSIFKVTATNSKALPVAMLMCAEVMHGKFVSPIDHTIWGEKNSNLNKHLPSIHQQQHLLHQQQQTNINFTKTNIYPSATTSTTSSTSDLNKQTHINDYIYYILSIIWHLLTEDPAYLHNIHNNIYNMLFNHMILCAGDQTYVYICLLCHYARILC